MLLRRSEVSWGAARGERPAPNESELDTARAFGEQAERRDAPARVGPVRSLWPRPHPQQRHRTSHADWGRCQGGWSEDGKKASWPKSGPLRRTGTSRRWQNPHGSDETANHRGAKGGREMNTAKDRTGPPTLLGSAREGYTKREQPGAGVGDTPALARLRHGLDRADAPRPSEGGTTPGNGTRSSPKSSPRRR